jgi:threonine dehydrogenase-like Zn-dependent dehydrogenase
MLQRGSNVTQQAEDAMKGVVLAGDRKVEIREFPDPTPGPGEVVLEIKASGMCGSDLKFYRAVGGAASLGFKMPGGPIIAGHEPCGVVAAVGPGVSERQARVGQRAMQHHYRGCGVCPHCATGWMQMCVEGVAEVYGATGHGAHARYMKCPARTLVTLPDELSFDAGAAISCGTGTAWGALHRLALTGDQTLAVFGQGPVGLSATLLAAEMGARVIALDTSEERLSRAKEFGADVLINPAKTDNVVQAIKDETHGLGAHASIDASSSPIARAQAVRCVRSWGKACFVGEGDSVTLDVSNDLLRRQVTLIGSWTFSTIGQADCARYVADRNIDIDRLFTHQWRLDQAEEAYRLFDQQTSGKGVIRPS